MPQSEPLISSNQKSQNRPNYSKKKEPFSFLKKIRSLAKNATMPSRIPKFATDFDFFTLPRLLFLLIITIFFFRKKRKRKNQTPQTRANPPDRYESGGKNPRTEGYPRTRIKENWFYLKSQDITTGLRRDAFHPPLGSIIVGTIGSRF